MHTTTTKDELQRGMDIVSRISTKHQTLPVLQCVLIKTNTNGISLHATNLELGVSVTISATNKEEGVVAVPAQTLSQTISLLNQKEVTLEVKENSLFINTKGSKAEIKTLNHKEFPSIPTIETKPQTLNGALFALGIKTAAFAASQSSIKPELGSVYLHQKKEHTLTFVATDSFRLVEKTTQQQGVVLDAPIMIPSRNALELARVCEVVNEDVNFCVSENQISLSFDSGVYITSRLVEGSFPDYKSIIPKEFQTNATLLVSDLVHALKMTNVFSNTFMQVRFSVNTKRNILTVSSQSGEVGNTEGEVAAVADGGDLELSFNQRYLSEPLTHFSDESITLKFAGIGRPMVMEGVADQSFRYLVMPMNK